ncbi:protein of unknown function [Streptomyces sp. KY70]|nr:protein of unknown function [Streptomyces sp. KY70]
MLSRTAPGRTVGAFPGAAPGAGSPGSAGQGGGGRPVAEHGAEDLSGAADDGGRRVLGQPHGRAEAPGEAVGDVGPQRTAAGEHRALAQGAADRAVPVLPPHGLHHVEDRTDQGDGQRRRVQVAEPGLGLPGVGDPAADEEGDLGELGAHVDDEQRACVARSGVRGGGPGAAEDEDARRSETGEELPRGVAVDGAGEDGVAEDDDAVRAVGAEGGVGDAAEEPPAGLGVDDASAPDGPLGAPVEGEAGAVEEVAAAEERVGDQAVAGHPGPGAGAAEVQGESPGGHGPAAEPAVSVAHPERPGPTPGPGPLGPTSVTKRSGTLAEGAGDLAERPALFAGTARRRDGTTASLSVVRRTHRPSPPVGRPQPSTHPSAR